ncbi:MAG: N-acetylmuramoyl-L-alanine amidase [Betaproteobacteria bacterium]|nr:N-acetylmuramoyl-L-alanine amidase [Betaproteobacteria bacterium]
MPRLLRPCAPRLTGLNLERRRFCQWLTVPALPALVPGLAWANAAPQVQSARLWPAREYTRLTLESSAPLAYQVLAVKSPERLVLDLEGVELAPELLQLASRVLGTDPHVIAVRVAKNKPGVVRIVLDLRAEMNPQVFTLKPVGDYGHRLVLDLYPTEAPDPMLSLLEQHERKEAALALAGREDDGGKGRGANSAKGRGKRPIIVVLDPGHGGEDPGAVGRKGTYEKNITLAVANKLKAQIEREANYRVVLTRDGDYFVPLTARVEKARRLRADLFISIHADAFPKKSARGASVFALSENGATSAAASWLAQRENQADLIGGVNLDVKDPFLARTLLDLSQTATISDSLKLGREVLSEIGELNTLHKAYVEQAGFAVLKAPDVPSILVETAFISNPEEEKRLRDDKYQTQLAGSILGGVKRYFAQNPPLARTQLALLE